MDNVTTFEKFEHEVIRKLLEKDTATNRLLREQYRNAQVVSREFTGVGFFTYFKVSENVARITEPVECAYGNIICDINGIKDFGGGVLFIEEGAMKCLEGYTFYDKWPTAITSYSFHHMRSHDT